MKGKKKNVTGEYAVMLYDRKEMHNIPISDVQFTISDQLFLDVLLMKRRSKTIAYATMKKRKTKEQEEQLEENIKPLEKKVQRTGEEKKKLEDLKSKLIEIRSKREWKVYCYVLEPDGYRKAKKCQHISEFRKKTLY